MTGTVPGRHGHRKDPMPWGPSPGEHLPRSFALAISVSLLRLLDQSV
jgi:hypothetical protein